METRDEHDRKVKVHHYQPEAPFLQRIHGQKEQEMCDSMKVPQDSNCSSGIAFRLKVFDTTEAGFVTDLISVLRTFRLAKLVKEEYTKDWSRK